MTPPASVLIGTIRYRISTDPDEWVKFEHGIQRANDYGHTDNDAAVILVNPKSAPEGRVAGQPGFGRLPHGGRSTSCQLPHDALVLPT